MGPVDLRDVAWVLTNRSMAWHQEHDLWSTPVPRVRPTGVAHGWFWGLYSGGTRPTIACGIRIPLRSSVAERYNSFTQAVLV
jgi:hypothetical protein